MTEPQEESDFMKTVRILIRDLEEFAEKNGWAPYIYNPYFPMQIMDISTETPRGVLTRFSSSIDEN